uniref:Uncharacterized protein n=1 Tax=Oryza brachyantha TaxID=4533 RepID=J3M3N1_ORYBR
MQDSTNALVLQPANFCCHNYFLSTVVLFQLLKLYSDLINAFIICKVYIVCTGKIHSLAIFVKQMNTG